VPKTNHHRINEIIQQALKYDYDLVWDLCCDHGQIGLGILKENPYQEIQFVDRVKDITDKLNNRIIDSYITIPKNISVVNKDIRILDINNIQNNLFILAGIGGYLTIEMLSHILESNISSHALICAHQNIIELRKYLSDNHFNLIEEKLICENEKFYELILIEPLITKPTKKVSPEGSILWSHFTSNHQKYLNQQITYLSTVLEHQDNPYLSNLKNAYLEIFNKNR